MNRQKLHKYGAVVDALAYLASRYLAICTTLSLIVFGPLALLVGGPNSAQAFHLISYPGLGASVLLALTGLTRRFRTPVEADAEPTDGWVVMMFGADPAPADHHARRLRRDRRRPRGAQGRR